MFKHLSIKKKLIFFAITMVIFIGLVGFAGYYYIDKGNKAAAEMYNDCLIPVNNLNVIRNHFRAIEGDMLYILTKSDNGVDYEAFLADILERREEIGVLWEGYKQTNLDPQEAEQVPAYEKAFNELLTLREHVLSKVEAKDYKGAEAAMEPYREKIAELSLIVKSLVTYNYERANSLHLQNDQDYDFAIKIIMGYVVLTLVVSTLLSFVIIRAVRLPLEKLKRELDYLVAQGGDLTRPIDITTKDEIGQLAKSLNHFLSNLREIIAGVKTESELAYHSVGKLNQNIATLNSSVEEVSATTEELSASMEETAASTELVNRTSLEIERMTQAMAIKALNGAKASRQIHDRASSLAAAFNLSLTEATTIFEQVKGNLDTALQQAQAVNQINALSDAILQITAQTNLLALNAAIEAARAGEVGRGFAVVADEIRKLAEDSKNTVAQIQSVTDIVRDSVGNLSLSSTELLDFVSRRVMDDYESMVQGAQGYQADAIYLDALIGEFSVTSESLSDSIGSVIKVIEEVTKATDEGASGTTNIAQRAGDIVFEANDILHESGQVKQNLDRMILNVSKFSV